LRGRRRVARFCEVAHERAFVAFVAALGVNEQHGWERPLADGLATAAGTSVPPAALWEILLSSMPLAQAGTLSTDAKMTPAMTSLFMVFSPPSSGHHSGPVCRVTCAVKIYFKGDAYALRLPFPGGHP
jgi:hypothetical protein